MVAPRTNHTNQQTGTAAAALTTGPAPRTPTSTINSPMLGMRTPARNHHRPSRFHTRIAYQPTRTKLSLKIGNFATWAATEIACTDYWQQLGVISKMATPSQANRHKLQERKCE